MSELQRKNLSFKKSTMYQNLYVKGFDNNIITDDLLKIHFEAYGEVKNAKITSNGTAYVCFFDRESARKAKDASTTTPFYGRFLRVEYFEPKELRQLQKEEIHDKQQYQLKKSKDLLNTPLNQLQQSSFDINSLI